MTSLSAPFNTKAPAAFQAFTKPGSYPDTATINLHRHLRRVSPPVLKDHPGHSVSALAHEVRNPLTNIDLAVEMLGTSIKDESGRIYLDIIMRSSLRINNLVNELLKYRQADQARPQKHSIHQLLDEVLEMAADRLMLKKIVVSKEYTAEDYEMVFDRSKVSIALTNIVINAIDAMKPGTGELKLITKLAGNKYIIQIEDNGCGISKDNLKNIFKPYFTGKPGGLGLGLATTHDILESAHIELLVASEEGIGTRFILLFDKTHR